MKKIFGLLISIIFGLSTAFVIWYINSPVAVSGHITSNDGKNYSNRVIKIGKTRTVTDQNGQFFTHVHRGLTYKVDGENINFKIKAWTPNNVKITGHNVSAGMSVSTSDNRVKMTTRNDTIYLDRFANVKYDKLNQKIEGDSNLDFQKNDKIVVAPTSDYPDGVAGKITAVAKSDGHFIAKIAPTHVEQALNKLSIHSGKVKGSDLVELTDNSRDNYLLQPMDFNISKKKTMNQHTFSYEDELNIKKKKVKIQNELSFGGSIEISADFNFKEPQKSKTKIINRLKIDDDTNLGWETKTIDEEDKGEIKIGVLGIPGLPFVTLPQSIYYSGKVSAGVGFNLEANSNTIVAFDYKNKVSVQPKSSSSGAIHVDGSANGELGFQSGIALTVFKTELLKTSSKFGLEGNGTASLKVSFTNSEKVTSKGSVKGDLDFVNKLEIGSPYANEIIGEKVRSKFLHLSKDNKAEFTYTKEFARISLSHKNFGKLKENPKNTKVKNKQKKHSMDINAIQKGDFSSVVGTWQNSAGDVMEIDKEGRISHTDATTGETYPQSKIYIDKDFIESAGNEYYIGTKIQNGVLKTHEGSIPLRGSASPVTPFWFIPSGVRLTTIKDTNTNGFSDSISFNQDRIFTGQQLMDGGIFTKKSSNIHPSIKRPKFLDDYGIQSNNSINNNLFADFYNRELKKAKSSRLAIYPGIMLAHYQESVLMRGTNGKIIHISDREGDDEKSFGTDVYSLGTVTMYTDKHGEMGEVPPMSKDDPMTLFGVNIDRDEPVYTYILGSDGIVYIAKDRQDTENDSSSYNSDTDEWFISNAEPTKNKDIQKWFTKAMQERGYVAR